MFKIDYFIFKYFLTSKMSNGSPLLNRILFFPKNKLFSVMSNCSTNCGIVRIMLKACVIFGKKVAQNFRVACKLMSTDVYIASCHKFEKWYSNAVAAKN
jgi:hypothetical protein